MHFLAIEIAQVKDLDVPLDNIDEEEEEFEHKEEEWDDIGMDLFLPDMNRGDEPNLANGSEIVHGASLPQHS